MSNRVTYDGLFRRNYSGAVGYGKYARQLELGQTMNAFSLDLQYLQQVAT